MGLNKSKKRLKSSKIRNLFNRGAFEELLNETLYSEKAFSHQDQAYVVGSLSFLGQVQQAEDLLRLHKAKLQLTEQAFCYFFLALGWVRKSQFSKAKTYLLGLKKLSLNQKKNQKQLFFFYQGVAFYFHFLGKFQNSLSWSKKALNYALKDGDLWMKALAYDLIGNNLIQNGVIYEGIQNFKKAKKCFLKLKNEGLVKAVEVSELIYSCEYGIDIKNSIEKLTRMYRSERFSDGFSKANLGLEYVRQLTYTGQWSMAQQVLNDLAPTILASQNRRQEARLYLRWADLHFAKGEAAEALVSVRSGQRSLEYVDQTYELQFIEIERNIFEQLYGKPVSNDLIVKEKELRKKFPEFQESQIRSYLNKGKAGGEQAKKIIFETGYFTWLHRFFPFKKGVDFIILNLQPKSITYIVNQGIFHYPKTLTDINYKIINLLASKSYVSKEELLQQVWGYNYDPLRHDSLIYSGLSSLRKVFQNSPYLIETSEMGYSIKAGIINMIEGHNTKVISAEVALEPYKFPEANKILNLNQTKKLLQYDLNARMLQILQYLRENRFVSVKEVCQIFEVSEITASRDLRALFEKKLVLRLGKGRATCYTESGEVLYE